MIIHLSKMINKILPTCLQGYYRYSLGKFSCTPYVVFGAERVKMLLPTRWWLGNLIYLLCYQDNRGWNNHLYLLDTVRLEWRQPKTRVSEGLSWHGIHGIGV